MPNGDSQYWTLVLEGLIALFTFAATWGTTKSQLREQAERLKDIEEKYITRQEFTLTITDMKDQHKEMRGDLKRVLEILSTTSSRRGR